MLVCANKMEVDESGSMMVVEAAPQDEYVLRGRTANEPAGPEPSENDWQMANAEFMAQQAALHELVVSMWQKNKD